MSETLGQPSLVPSNATGASGINGRVLSSTASGVLNTIEEGPGAANVSNFYYPAAAAMYTTPSLMRAVGDDRRTFNVKSFGGRGTVTLPRKHFNNGFTCFRFTLDQDYAYAGPEYHAVKTYAPANSAPLIASNFHISVGANTNRWADTGALAAQMRDDILYYDSKIALLKAMQEDLLVEYPTTLPVLPTYFMSGGAGFAFCASFEMNMGGAGNLIYDRYANFAGIMASCPTKEMRRHLMRLAGGGLYFDPDSDEAGPYRAQPVRPMVQSGGHALSGAYSDFQNRVNLPNLHEMIVPLKTPDTNFWQSLHARKPFDSSLTPNDLQITITFGNFFEICDTGKGLANNPFYRIPVTDNSPAEGAAPVTYPSEYLKKAAAVGPPVVIASEVDPRYEPDITVLNPFIFGFVPSGHGHPDRIQFLDTKNWSDLNYLFGRHDREGSPAFYNTVHYKGKMITNMAPIAETYNVEYLYIQLKRLAANPRIWANHYRVCEGDVYGHQTSTHDNFWRERVPEKNHGRFLYPRPGGGVTWDGYSGTGKAISTMSPPAIPSDVTYPTQFTEAEYINMSLKLTNPSLSAMNALRQTGNQGSVVYPFQYMFGQQYRVTNDKFKSILRWNYTGVQNQYVNRDLYDPGNAFSMLIQMPANPVTSMIIGIYREKDRVFIPKNKPNSYSPVLFWHALTPLSIRLWDGGNILFDYRNRTFPDLYSHIDRPDVFRIPFRGGCCQLLPENIIQCAQWTVDPSDVLSRLNLPDALFNDLTNFPGSRRPGYQSQSFRNSGFRYQGIHSTEEYESCLIEFPFALYEPFSREGMVQNVPTFAKTQLRLEFWLDPLLKPQRGLDDHYSLTTNLPSNARWFDSNAAQQVESTAVVGSEWAGRDNMGNCTLMVPDVHHLCPPTQLEMYSIARERKTTAGASSSVSLYAPGVAQTAQNAYSFNPGTMSEESSSWNINNSDFLISVVFTQNQVWSMSPKRSVILSGRG
jgi:hypothetical protein